MSFCKVIDDRARVLRSIEKFVGIYPDIGLKRTDTTVDGCQQQGHPPPRSRGTFHTAIIFVTKSIPLTIIF